MKPKLNLWLLFLVFAGFISLGLPDGLLGVAWPSMRNTFGLPLEALGSLLVMYTAGYLLASFSSGWLLARLNVGALLALSCLATGVSLLGYSASRHWWMMMALGALAGLGAGAIDAGLNTYAATHFSARLVNWLHAFYGIGALSGPLLMTGVLDRGHPWQAGYALVGGGQFALALCFALTLRHWNDEQPVAATTPAAAAPQTATLRLPAAWFGIAVFFVYTGIEAVAGAWAYSLLTEARGVPMMTAGWWVSLYWGALTAGRILAALFAHRLSSTLLLRACIAGQAAGALLLWLNFNLPGLMLIGLACAPIFPTLLATTPQRLASAHVANAVGFQIAAAVLGQSLLPALVGILAQRHGLEIIASAIVAAALLLYALHESMTATQPQADPVTT